MVSRRSGTNLELTSAIWQFSFRFSLVFTSFLVSGNLGNLEWEYILQIVKGQVRIDFTRLNLARPCRQVSWKTDMGFHVATFQGFFRFFLVFSVEKPLETKMPNYWCKEGQRKTPVAGVSSMSDRYRGLGFQGNVKIGVPESKGRQCDLSGLHVHEVVPNGKLTKCQL